MIVIAWNNGSSAPSGAGYGLKISLTDRDRYFRREWKTVILVLEDWSIPVEINVAKPSFWGETCHELISAQVGRWLLKNRLAPWPENRPPKLILEPLGETGHFLLRQL